MTPPRILLIGYGNPGRQDDGLGPAAALQIAALDYPHVTAFENYQLAIEDALDVARHDEVWFVDAARSGQAPFALSEIEPAPAIGFTSHLLSPAALLAITSRYCEAVPKAYLLAIRGYEFEMEERLTPPAEANLAEAVALLRSRIGGEG